MLHTIGDCHCDATFRGLRGLTGIIAHPLAPLTMKRVGHMEDNLLPDAVKALNLSPDDTLLVSCGEIDVRLWIPVHLARRKDGNLPAMLREWASAYIERAQTLPTQAKIALLGVPPPAIASRVWQPEGALITSPDQDRAAHTRLLNTILAEECAAKNMPLVDLSAFADPHGMLPLERSDGAHHASCPALAAEALYRAGISLENIDIAEPVVKVEPPAPAPPPPPPPPRRRQPRPSDVPRLMANLDTELSRRGLRGQAKLVHRAFAKAGLK